MDTYHDELRLLIILRPANNRQFKNVINPNTLLRNVGINLMSISIYQPRNIAIYWRFVARGFVIDF